MHGGKGNGGKINLTIHFNYENYCSIMGISMIFMLLGMMVQFRLKSKFATYRKVATSSGLNGKEIAEKMLRDNGIYDVQVTSVSGFFIRPLRPPTKKTVNLSEEVYEGTNV
jgi:uncharacterized protein